ncbi:hypothetical protein ME0901_05040 [Lactobacillus delbrueckii subsp. bulgaricus]|uniref:Uncharacterized protein n=1 Tax=Lactobacillus delbrueckii subsp. bulgaricus TaxID=1585 RepID=A0AAV5PD42_LACDE|nr:hypothetical protein ME0899_05080 [Lactobacillus delbrueckii subsp. bulgaricus]GMB86975.1 hypothetical protein ME0900_13480 [Lactobacillus delbrueckii subsp. bulgaricus]GMB87984.1 hypothetical protein ME0901_05040 [Lactobacillus delbrueckii subsp. bulgaricus]
MMFFGAPAFKAASYKIWAAWIEHFWAFGWKEKMMAFLVFKATRILNMVVEVGLVVGTIPAKTPRGAATLI